MGNFSGFLCPNCNSWRTEYIFGNTSIECTDCGHVWDPGDEEDECEFTCPRCGSNELDIDDDVFFCNNCHLEGDVENLE